MGRIHWRRRSWAISLIRRPRAPKTSSRQQVVRETLRSSPKPALLGPELPVMIGGFAPPATPDQHHNLPPRREADTRPTSNVRAGIYFRLRIYFCRRNEKADPGLAGKIEAFFSSARSSRRRQTTQIRVGLCQNGIRQMMVALFRLSPTRGSWSRF